MRLIYLAFAWAAGIVTAAQFGGVSTVAWLLAALIAGIVLVAVRRQVSTLAGFGLLPDTSDIAQFNNTGGLTIEGRVVGDPDVRDDRTQIRIAVETVIRGGQVFESDGLVLVRAPRLTDVANGDTIRATGLLIPPGEFDNFSYADFLARQNTFSIMDRAAVEVIEPGAWTFGWALYDLRRDVIAAIGRHLPEPQAGLLAGILTGNERGISPELDNDFSRTGASHVIAISGFNMVIIGGVVMGLLNRFNVRKGRATVIGIVVLALYTLFAGANAAVVRAAVMSSLLFIGQALNRRTYVPTSLAFVALVMSALDPDVLWDVSFQLSFFATLGLALYVEPMQRGFDAFLQQVFPLPLARNLSGFLSEPLIVTLAAQITTLPLIMLYFNRLSLVAVGVNLLIVPVQAPLLILGGVATLIAPLVSPIAQVFYWVDMLFLTWTIEVVRAFADLPFAERVVYIQPEWITAYFAVLIGWAVMAAAQPIWWERLVNVIRGRVVMSAVAFSGFAILVLMGAVINSRPDGRLHVWFLDVGHSNGVLMQTPGGAHLLVDGGRFPSRLLTAIGDRLPFTDREIEVLAITQPDEFDTDALTAVLDRYEVGVILTNGQPNLSPAIAEIEARLADETVITATAGYTLELADGVLVEVLHPARTPDLADNLNDAPLVLRVTYGEVSFLLTGDLSVDGQAALLDSGRWPLATVMQLPQHGTARSLDADFLNAVQPQAITVQIDPANRRGDPDPDVLALLPEGVPLLRTDASGTVHLWTDGQRLWTSAAD